MTAFRVGALEITRIEDFVDHGVPIKFLLPELDWERKGVVPNVIFLEGLIGSTAYYGAADHVVGAARLKITFGK